MCPMNIALNNVMSMKPFGLFEGSTYYNHPNYPNPMPSFNYMPRKTRISYNSMKVLTKRYFDCQLIIE